MTTITPTPGTDPDLRDYVSNLQAKACRLAGVMRAAAHLENAGTCNEGRVTLIYMAEELAEELYRALDIVSLP
jgi:hypothetical protein